MSAACLRPLYLHRTLCTTLNGQYSLTGCVSHSACALCAPCWTMDNDRTTSSNTLVGTHAHGEDGAAGQRKRAGKGRGALHAFAGHSYRITVLQRSAQLQL